MRETHAGFCADHTEGICRAGDLIAGKWEIGLSNTDGETTVRAWHPEILPDETRGGLSPTEAVELGQALMIQGMRGLRTADRPARPSGASTGTGARSPAQRS